MPFEDFYLQAYYNLSTEKGASGLIPWRAVIAYADEFGLDEQMKDAFTNVILFVDARYTDQLEREAESKRALQSPKNKQPKSKTGFYRG